MQESSVLDRVWHVSQWCVFNIKLKIGLFAGPHYSYSMYCMGGVILIDNGEV